MIDELNTYGETHKSFHISKEMLALAWLAWSNYQEYVENKAKEQAAEQSIQEQEKERQLNLVDRSCEKEAR